jgi:hypothetical protein
MDELRKHLSTFTLLLTAFTSFALLESIIYEYAYFSVIGSRFLSLLGASDYLRETVLWLPPLAMVVIFSAVAGISIREIHDARREHAQATGDLKSAGGAGQIEGIARLVGGVLFLASVYALFSSPLLYLPVMVLAGIVFGIVTFARDETHQQFFKTNKILAAVLIASSVIATVYMKGVSDAYQEVSFDAPTYRIVATNRPLDVTVLKFLDKGALVWSRAERHVIFFPWDDVKSLEREQIIPRRSLSSWLIGTDLWNPFKAR